MTVELGQISFFLSNPGSTFQSVVDNKNIPRQSDLCQIREFKVDGIPAKFICVQAVTNTPQNPPWIDFVNEQLDADAEEVNFETNSRRPSGLLLLQIDNRVIAATFGVRGSSLIDRTEFLPDFGIKTAMNMCGNRAIRQTRSSTHSYTTQHIDRQLSRPSDALSFGLSDSEMLRFISAQLPDNSNISLQGKDRLTIKIRGREKLTWDRVLSHAKTFIAEYGADRYKTLFPNYPNFQDVPEEIEGKLDNLLVENIVGESLNRIHMAIPEFIPDDQYSFAYTNYPKRPNNIYSHISIADLYEEGLIDSETLTADQLKNKYVYAYSHDEQKILEYMKLRWYECIVAEIDEDAAYYILSNGKWKKVDEDFHNAINEFIENTLPQIEIDERYTDIDIVDETRGQNREELFNKEYCAKNENAILFDQAKLRVGNGPSDKEFCDFLEHRNDEPMHIVHVKKHGGSSDISYLFTQARFYGESFLTDDVFLQEIRGHIEASGNPNKERFLEYIECDQANVVGKDYAVGLWILYDNRKSAPTKSTLPLMAKYDLKMTYERLVKIQKFSSVSISMIPVNIAKIKTEVPR